MIRFGLLALCVCLGHASVHAQCPDGSAPPCGSTLALPPMQDDTWLVVPFALSPSASALSWMQPGGSHLLALELSRIGERVAVDDTWNHAWFGSAQGEFLAAVSREAVLVRARQRGAGRVVIGALRPAGESVRMTVTLLATATGTVVRSVEGVAPAPEAFFGAITTMARELTETSTTDPATSGLGTASVAAYREYLMGRRALTLARFDSAESSFSRATNTDSMFALAHAGLAMTRLQRHDGEPSLVRAAAMTASRLGQGLPGPVRTRISIALAMAEVRYADACRSADLLIAGDSTDADAWYWRGECHFHDKAVIRDGSTAQFRSSWHQALRSFEQAAVLAPTMTVAYPHIPEMLSTFARRGCSVDEFARVCPERWAGVVRLVGDSLRTMAFDVSRGQVEPQPPTPAQMREMTGALAARELAAASVWFATAPASDDARLMFVEALLRNGDVARAGQEAVSLPGAKDASPASIRRLEATVDAAVQSGDAATATQRLDDAMAFIDETPATAALRTIIATRRALLGQFAAIAALPQQPSPTRAYAVLAMRVAAGLPGDSLERLASGHRAFVLQSAAANVAPQLEGVLGAAGEAIAVGTPWPFARTGGNPTPINQLARARVAKNPDAMARRLAALDELVSDDARPDINGILFQLSGEAHLILGDSTVALERFRGFLARVPRTATTIILENEEPIYTSLLWGRGALATGDLAIALGDQTLARTAYQFVVSLWARADAALQPAVTRAQAALENLPPS